MIEPKIFEQLLTQLSIDYACAPSDFLSVQTRVVPFRSLPGRRQFGEEEPFF